MDDSSDMESTSSNENENYDEILNEEERNLYKTKTNVINQ